MSHIHWVAQQNKLEIPKDKDEVNKQHIHEDSSALSRRDGSDTAEFFFSVSISFFLSVAPFAGARAQGHLTLDWLWICGDALRCC
jgi:hypothetical protein